MTALHHEIAGPADAHVLLLGGSLGTTLEMWEAQRPLAERFRVVTFDHRGHGRSPSPAGPYEIADLGRDVLELMDKLGVERASYCGLSIGGMVGMWLGAHASSRIDHLVLLCTAAYMPPASAWRARAQAVLAAGSPEPVADAIVERWLTPQFATGHPEVRDRLRAMLAGSDAAGYAACCGAIERMDLRTDLARVAAPTLVVSGAQDLATPVDRQALIAERIAGARHEVIDPGAHVVAVERPEAVNALIEEFLT